MKVQCLSSDIISTLPQDLINRILCDLPIKDAVRTSILSRKWKYSWASIPKLKFEDKKFEVTSNDRQNKKYKFVNAIFHALLFRKGPLLKFHLSISELNMTSEIDQMISYLSRSNTLEYFFLKNDLHHPYKLPSSFFSFERLERLALQCCVIQLPLTFNGFSMLKNLILCDVRVTAKMLQCLLLTSPVLETLYLKGCRGDFREGNKFTFVELFECLPSIVNVHITDYYVEYLAEGGMPSKLSSSLVHLRSIYLAVSFIKEDELSSLLCLIRSSPNLMKITIEMCDKQKLVEQTSMNFLDLQDYSSFNLNHLKQLTIKPFRISPPAVEFLKLVMAKSPMLMKVQITLDSTTSVDEESKLFRDLLRRHFTRASPSAEFIIDRLIS